MIECGDISEGSWATLRSAQSKKKNSSHSEWIRHGRRGRPYIYLNVSTQGVCRILVETTKEDLAQLNRLSSAGLIVESQPLTVEYHPPQEWIVVGCTAPAHLAAFTQIVQEISALVLKERCSVSVAINAVILKWRSFWGRPAGSVLTEDQQLGLAGELMVLERLIKLRGPESVRCWMGPAGKHDFEARNIHLEIKTTLRGRHSHIINGIDQLEAPVGRRLILISILAAGSLSRGTSLVSSVAKIEKILSKAPADYHRFTEMLFASGYRREHELQYAATQFAVSAERWMEVVPEFPRLSSKSLRVGLSSRITEVRYRLDLEGLNSLAVPSKIVRALQLKELRAL